MGCCPRFLETKKRMTPFFLAVWPTVTGANNTLSERHLIGLTKGQVTSRMERYQVGQAAQAVFSQLPLVRGEALRRGLESFPVRHPE